MSADPPGCEWQNKQDVVHFDKGTIFRIGVCIETPIRPLVDAAVQPCATNVVKLASKDSWAFSNRFEGSGSVDDVGGDKFIIEWVSIGAGPKAHAVYCNYFAQKIERCNRPEQKNSIVSPHRSGYFDR